MGGGSSCILVWVWASLSPVLPALSHASCPPFLKTYGDLPLKHIQEDTHMFWVSNHTFLVTAKLAKQGIHSSWAKGESGIRHLAGSQLICP